jgi:hypothetical protein
VAGVLLALAAIYGLVCRLGLSLRTRTASSKCFGYACAPPWRCPPVEETVAIDCEPSFVGGAGHSASGPPQVGSQVHGPRASVRVSALWSNPLDLGPAAIAVERARRCKNYPSSQPCRALINPMPTSLAPLKHNTEAAFASHQSARSRRRSRASIRTRIAGHVCLGTPSERGRLLISRLMAGHVPWRRQAIPGRTGRRTGRCVPLGQDPLTSVRIAIGHQKGLAERVLSNFMAMLSCGSRLTKWQKSW